MKLVPGVQLLTANLWQSHSKRQVKPWYSENQFIEKCSLCSLYQSRQCEKKTVLDSLKVKNELGKIPFDHIHVRTHIIKQRADKAKLSLALKECQSVSFKHLVLLSRN